VAGVLTGTVSFVLFLYIYFTLRDQLFRTSNRGYLHRYPRYGTGW